MGDAESDFVKRYLRQQGEGFGPPSAENALFSVLAELNETAMKLRTTIECGQNCPGVPKEQIEELVEKAAQLAADKAVVLINANFYQTVGKNFINKSLTVIGVGVCALAAWAKGKGII